MVRVNSYNPGARTGLTIHEIYQFRDPDKQQHNENTIVRTWFSSLLRHPDRKWSETVLTTSEPAWGTL